MVFRSGMCWLIVGNVQLEGARISIEHHLWLVAHQVLDFMSGVSELVAQSVDGSRADPADMVAVNTRVDLTLIDDPRRDQAMGRPRLRTSYSHWPMPPISTTQKSSNSGVSIARAMLIAVSNRSMSHQYSGGPGVILPTL